MGGLVGYASSDDNDEGEELQQEGKVRIIRELFMFTVTEAL
jgi:hypothetical protein